MEFNKKSNQGFNSNKIKTSDSYSVSDEQLFNKSITHTEKSETKKELIDTGGKHKKTTTPNNLDLQSDAINTHEYSKEDIQKFDKLTANK